MGNFNNENVKKQLNRQNISSQIVYQVTCKTCLTILSKRGCKISFASQLTITGYSTDTIFSEIIESKEFTKWKQCNCLSLKIYCKNCNKECGFHVLYLCLYCQKQPTNGHNWLFLDVQGVPTGKIWGQIEQKPIIWKSFQEVLKVAGISPATMQILKKEEIQNFNQLQSLNDQLLREAGLTLGQLARLRQFK